MSPHNATIQPQAAAQKAGDSPPLPLHFKGIKRDGFLKHRA
jgi:hypothetical protein